MGREKTPLPKSPKLTVGPLRDERFIDKNGRIRFRKTVKGKVVDWFRVIENDPDDGEQRWSKFLEVIRWTDIEGWKNPETMKRKAQFRFYYYDGQYPENNPVILHAKDLESLLNQARRQGYITLRNGRIVVSDKARVPRVNERIRSARVPTS
jgi:hypothetical protein